MNTKYMFVAAAMTVMLIGATALASSSSASAISRLGPVPLTFGIAAPINTDLAALGSPGILSGNVVQIPISPGVLSGNVLQVPISIPINFGPVFQ